MPIKSSSETNDLKKLENEKRGRDAEILFSKFLDDNKIPFVYVDQRKETASEEMLEGYIRRPDFIVHTKYGFYFIDVKCRKKLSFGDEKRFYLMQDEVNSLNNLKEKLQANVWIAFIDDKDPKNHTKFFYSPITIIYDYYEYIFNDNLKKAYENFSKCPIFIPNILLYDCFSAEKGFYKMSDVNYSTTDMDYYKKSIDNWS